jgi:hypothetical protein
MKEVPDDPWFIDKAARRAAGESDVQFFIETPDAPWIWPEHPHVLRTERAKSEHAWVKEEIARLWLPYPAWSDQAYTPLGRYEPARPPNLIISNDGKMPPNGFWTLHPLIEFDRTEFDDDGGGFWRTSIWLRDVSATEEETAAMLTDVLSFTRTREA